MVVEEAVAVQRLPAQLRVASPVVGVPSEDKEGHWAVREVAAVLTTSAAVEVQVELKRFCGGQAVLAGLGHLKVNKHSRCLISGTVVTSSSLVCLLHLPLSLFLNVKLGSGLSEWVLPLILGDKY